MQPKKLTKVQVGPRLLKCPVCGNITARIEAVSNSSGRSHRKIICHAINCRSERNV
jgi:hypothetical protein